MLFPIIKVKDSISGDIHIVGTDKHDSLIVLNNNIHYNNMQNGEGTGEDGEYEFVINDKYIGYIEMVTFEELEKIYRDNLEKEKQAEAQSKEFEKLLDKAIKKYFD